MAVSDLHEDIGVTDSTSTARSADPRLGNHRVARVIYTEEEIQRRISELGREIHEALEPDEELLVIGLLKGSCLFMADLVRAIPRTLELDFIRVASYGHARESSGEVSLLYDPETSLNGRSVVIVEDIVDTGTTLRWLIPHLRERNPRRLEVCALLHKRIVSMDPHPRWVGFDAPKEFLVGYGLDCAEALRNLPYIASLEPEE